MLSVIMRFIKKYEKWERSALFIVVIFYCSGLDIFDFLFCFVFPLMFVATEVVTVFVFQEPSLLSSLQDNGLTDVMLHALLIKDVSFWQLSFRSSIQWRLKLSTSCQYIFLLLSLFFSTRLLTKSKLELPCDDRWTQYFKHPFNSCCMETKTYKLQYVLKTTSPQYMGE